MSIKVLCINPGSTSTKVAVFTDETADFMENVMHSNEDLERFGGVQDQFDYRYGLIAGMLKEKGVDISAVDVVIGRGGALRPVSGSIFEITDAMLADCRSGKYSEHPSNLGCQLAKKFADAAGKPCYVVDPPLSDEFEDKMRISGHPAFIRRSAFHALNEKNVARRIAKELGKGYHDVNIVTTHLGSGVSVTAHKRGRCVDNTFGSGGDGPFSPERSGRLPAMELLGAMENDERTKKEWTRAFSKKSGMLSYFGTNNMLELDKRRQAGDAYVAEMFDAMTHMVAREVAAFCAAGLSWDVDAIGVTGAIANNRYITDRLRKELAFIAPVYVYPGEFEMQALAAGGRMALRGEEKPILY
jgi:butyrate kinase